MVRYSSESAARIYDIADRFVDRCLRNDSSLFVTGSAIWTRENVERLDDLFVDTSKGGSDRSFDEKLQVQLEPASDEVLQLMAELVTVHFLIAVKSTIGGGGQTQGDRQYTLPDGGPTVPAAGNHTGSLRRGQLTLDLSAVETEVSLETIATLANELFDRFVRELIVQGAHPVGWTIPHTSR